MTDANKAALDALEKAEKNLRDIGVKALHWEKTFAKTESTEARWREIRKWAIYQADEAAKTINALTTPAANTGEYYYVTSQIVEISVGEWEQINGRKYLLSGDPTKFIHGIALKRGYNDIEMIISNGLIEEEDGKRICSLLNNALAPRQVDVEWLKRETCNHFRSNETIGTGTALERLFISDVIDYLHQHNLLAAAPTQDTKGE